MIATIAIAAFVVSGVCALVRVLRGPTLADRVVALDVAFLALMGGIAADAIASSETSQLSLLVVVAIVGFTATVVASRFIEHEGTLP